MAMSQESHIYWWRKRRASSFVVKPQTRHAAVLCVCWPLSAKQGKKEWRSFFASSPRRVRVVFRFGCVVANNVHT